MSQPIIIVMTYGRNLYDHAADIEHEMRYEQASKDEATMEMYITHAKRTFAHSRIAWYAINELNVITGENKRIFYEAKPLQQRLEVNVAAKIAKKKPATWDVNPGFFTAPSTASILAQIAEMQSNSSQSIPEDTPEMSNDF